MTAAGIGERFVVVAIYASFLKIIHANLKNNYLKTIIIKYNFFLKDNLKKFFIYIIIIDMNIKKSLIISYLKEFAALPPAHQQIYLLLLRRSLVMLPDDVPELARLAGTSKRTIARAAENINNLQILSKTIKIVKNKRIRKKFIKYNDNKYYI